MSFYCNFAAFERVGVGNGAADAAGKQLKVIEEIPE